MTFDDIVIQLLSFRRSSLGNGATQAEIDAASTTLGVPVRGGYRMFLARFGYGGVADFELYGLGRNVPEDLDLVVMTQSERTEAHPNIPHHLLPIMNDGGGNHACLDTKASPDEPPVVWWWHEDGQDQIPQLDAADFLSWLAKRLKERAEYQ